MLQDMIKAENRALDEVSQLEDDVIQILEIRGYERSEFKLKIDLLDWDRNHKIRELLQNKVIWYTNTIQGEYEIMVLFTCF